MAEEARPVVILGVGNRLRGDDAVGCIVCDKLKETRPSSDVQRPSSPEPLVIDCGNTPENYIQPVTDGDPARILVVDCCDFRARPGEFRIFSRSEIEELSYGLLSTHTLPLTLLVEMLSLSTSATVELLGVQPQGIEFGNDLSEPVRSALPALLRFIRGWTRAESAPR